MTAWLIIFWSCVAIIMWAYVGFPLATALRALIRRRPVKCGNHTPGVSMIIACYNEADGIRNKLHNCLALDYPEDRLQIVVASDGSDDDTEAIVRSFADPRITLLCLPRLGKADALNAAVAKATGEILVFSDANSEYCSDAVRRLVAPFFDETIGGVAGNQVYRKDGDAHLAAAGESGYWNFDRLMKRWQSASGNVTSATGAIYAIRRSLFQSVLPGVTDDFVTSTAVIAQGQRLIFEPQAVCFEPVAGAAKAEFSRKTRVISRGLRAIWQRRALLNPLRYGFYSLQLFSHKVVRRLVAFPVAVLPIATAALWSEGGFYQLTLVAQLLFYGAALGGAALSACGFRPPKAVSIPFFFVMVNAAVLVASWNTLRGHRIDRWTTNRDTAPSSVQQQPGTTQLREASS